MICNAVRMDVDDVASLSLWFISLNWRFTSSSGCASSSTSSLYQSALYIKVSRALADRTIRGGTGEAPVKTYEPEGEGGDVIDVHANCIRYHGV